MVDIPEQAVEAAIAVIRAHDNEAWGEDCGDEPYVDLVNRMLTAAAPYMSGANKTTITECIMDFYGSDYAEGKRVFYNPYTGAVDAHDLFIFSKPAFERKVQERILSALEPSSAREQALEEAAQNAECHSDDRARRYSMDWNDGYIDGCKGAAAAIRALKTQPEPDGWQPIGVSTPRDRVILAWGNNWHWEGVEKAYLHSDYNGHKNVICRGGLAGEPFTLGRQDAPTHWHPIPPAPQTGGGK